MSSFTTVKYQSNAGDIHPLRVRSTFVSAIGSQPSGSIDSDINARTRKNSRQYGLRVRGWRLYRIIGSGANQFRRYTFLPKLTQSEYNEAFPETISISGVDWKPLARVPEDVD